MRILRHLFLGHLLISTFLVAPISVTADECLFVLYSSSHQDVCVNSENDCLGLSDELSAMCYTKLARATDRAEICSLITHMQRKADCYETLARDLNDESVCFNIEEGQYRDRCRIQYAVIRNDYTFCASLDSTRGRDECYYDFAQRKRNPDICEYVSETLSSGTTRHDPTKDECYFRLAEKERDPDLCMHVVDREKLGRCIGSVAKGSRSIEYCDYLEGLERQICIESAIDYIDFYDERDRIAVESGALDPDKTWKAVSEGQKESPAESEIIAPEPLPEEPPIPEETVAIQEAPIRESIPVPIIEHEEEKKVPVLAYSIAVLATLLFFIFVPRRLKGHK